PPALPAPVAPPRPGRGRGGAGPSRAARGCATGPYRPGTGGPGPRSPRGPGAADHTSRRSGTPRPRAARRAGGGAGRATGGGRRGGGGRGRHEQLGPAGGALHAVAHVLVGRAELLAAGAAEEHGHDAILRKYRRLRRVPVNLSPVVRR